MNAVNTTILADLHKCISNYFSGLSQEPINFVVEFGDGPEKGHITSNAALVASIILKEKPFIIGEQIKNYIHAQGGDALSVAIDKIEVAGPGFINVYLNRSYLAHFIRTITKEQSSVVKNNRDILSDTRILYEFTDPNPFKEFHIGHLMSNTIGESLSRIAEHLGAHVERACYQGDVGLHIAKTLWGLSQVVREKDETEIAYISRAYTFGSQVYDDQVIKKEIDELNAVIYQSLLDRKNGDQELLKKYDWGRAVSLAHFEDLYNLLGTKFDYYFFESEMAGRAVDFVKNNSAFELSDGAYIYRGEKHRLHTRVFINARGLPTYEAKELILNLVDKPARVQPSVDHSIIITANEQNEYFKVLLAAMNEVEPEIAQKMKHIGHGMMRFAAGKMSSRKGNTITGEHLIETIEQELSSHLAGREISEEEKKNIAKKVAIGAIKYVILRQSIGSDIIFDSKSALNVEGDSGPYLMYALVRARSVLEKAKKMGVRVEARLPTETIEGPEVLLLSFEHVLLRAYEHNAPHYIVHYATVLASAFNAYYAHQIILDVENPYSSYRLAVTKAIADTLEVCLNVLGMPVVEKM